MYITWAFLALLLLYGAFFLFFPFRGVLLLSFLIFLGLYGLDLLLTRRRASREKKVPAAKRSFKNPVYLGEVCRVEVRVENPFPRMLRVRVQDEPPHDLPAAGRKDEGAGPGVTGTGTGTVTGTGRGKRTGYARLSVPPRGSAAFAYELLPDKRGTFPFGRINLEYPGVLGLYSHRHVIGREESLRVYPDLAALNDHLRRILPGATPTAAYYRKLGDAGREFWQLREFLPGDDYRKINWKVTAHVGKPILNEYRPERDQSVYLFFDTGRLLYDRLHGKTTRLDHILDSAFILAYSILEQGDQIGGISFNQRVERFLPAGKGIRHLRLFLEKFYDLQAVMKESNYRAAFHFWQQRVKKRSLLFVYTDIVDAESSRELAEHLSLLARNHLVVCVLLPHPYLDRTAAGPVTSIDQLYKKGVALELRLERERLRKLLTGRGVKVLTTDAESIRRSAAQHYLFLKNKGLF
ncbi:MAG: DUF58 domain-containing protein [Firmicutes bacterium]|jgi:uncharacterized protein (DUF58 family)|nr:DUF58 domain-containing protein [Bacillota bacterium]